MNTTAHWLSTHLLPCFYKQALGFSCPLCGCQRAVVLLCQGQVWESVKMFPPLFPLAITLLLLALKPLTVVVSKKVIHVALIVDAVFLAFNMVYKNVIA